MLRAKVTESLTREKEAALKETRRRSVLDGLLALNEVEAPESMVEAEIDSAPEGVRPSPVAAGRRPEGSRHRLERRPDRREPGAIRRVKEYLLLDAIGEAENVAVSDTELDAELKRRAQAMGATFAELKSALQKNDRLEGVRESCGSTASSTSSSPRRPRRAES